MKIFNLILFFFTLSPLTGLISQENNEYLMVMLKQKEAFEIATTEQEFKELAQTFQRISNAESREWYPLYYAGLCYANMSFASQIKTSKEDYLDQAQYFVDAALELHPDESELHVLQALLYQGRIQIDPEQRGKVYSDKAEISLGTARDYNPANPRPYYLLGLNTLHKPEAYGGGSEQACHLFKQAAEKYHSYIPPHVLAPTWGGHNNQLLIDQNCPNE